MKRFAIFFLIFLMSFAMISCAQRKPEYYLNAYEPSKDQISTEEFIYTHDIEQTTVIDTIVPPDDTTPVYLESTEEGFPDISGSTGAVVQTPSFNGQNFRILTEDQYSYEIFCDETSATGLDPEVWTRNSKVEECLDICIKPQMVGGDSIAIRDALRTSVLAADGICEIALTELTLAGELVVSNVLNAWDDFEQLNLDAPHYNQDMNYALSLFGKHYFLSSDINVSSIGSTYVMTFNKVLGDKMGLTERVMSDVDHDSFTLDVLVDILSDVDFDIARGISADPFDFSSLIYGFDVPFITSEQDGLTINYYGDSFDSVKRGVKLLTKMFADDRGPTSATGENDFENCMALFSVMTIDKADNLADRMNNAVIFLPLPKLDDNQEGYSSLSNGKHTVVVCDRTVTDTDFVATVTDHLAQASVKVVETKITYYANNLHNKFISEIMKSRTSDISIAFDLTQKCFLQPVGQYIVNGNDYLGTYYDVCLPIIEVLKNELDMIVSNYKNNS